MELRTHFVRSGRWLFRHRSWLPLVPLVLVVVGLWGYRYPAGSLALHHAWGVSCLLLGLLGAAIRALTVGYIAGDTSVRARDRQVAETLNRRGAYSVVRHPLYLGNYFMWLGVSLVPRDPWIPLVVTLVFWLYYERIMAAEEDFLREKFGSRYEEWAVRTPAFVPALSRWEAEDRPFSWKMVIRREHSGVYGLVLAVSVLTDAAGALAGGPWLDPFWGWILAITTALFVMVLFIKRQTHLLDVTDR